MDKMSRENSGRTPKSWARFDDLPRCRCKGGRQTSKKSKGVIIQGQDYQGYLVLKRNEETLEGIYFSITRVIRPVATVRPPSRMLKRWPASAATGRWVERIISTLSPGWTRLDWSSSGKVRSPGSSIRIVRYVMTPSFYFWGKTHQQCAGRPGDGSCFQTQCGDHLQPQ